MNTALVVSTIRQMTMVPMTMGLPRSSLTVCFSLFRVMVFKEIFLAPRLTEVLPLRVTVVGAPPGLMPSQKGLTQK